MCVSRAYDLTMKRLLSIIAFMFAVPCQAQEWTPTDTAYEAAYLVLHTADWAQTRYIAAHPEQFNEDNKILGNNPSDSEVNRYFILTGLLHAGIAYALPERWRRGFQIVTIGIEAGVVSNNYQIGVQLKF